MIWLPFFRGLLDLGGGVILAAVALAVPAGVWLAMGRAYRQHDRHSDQEFRTLRALEDIKRLSRARKEEE